MTRFVFVLLAFLLVVGVSNAIENKHRIVNITAKEPQPILKDLLTCLTAFLKMRGLEEHSFIDEGTLLGYMRNKEIIPWDGDVDFAIPCTELENFGAFNGSDWPKKRDSIHETCKKVKAFNRVEYGMRFEAEDSSGAHADFAYCLNASDNVPPSQPCTLSGVATRCPPDDYARKRMEFHYGKDWIEPPYDHFDEKAGRWVMKTKPGCRWSESLHDHDGNKWICDGNNKDSKDQKPAEGAIQPKNS